MADKQPKKAKKAPKSSDAPQPAAAAAQQPPPATEPAQSPQPPAPQPQLQESPWQTAQQEQFVADTQPAPPPAFGPVSWSAAEYIEHEKPPMWYGIFIGITIAVTGIIFFLTEEVVASLAILVVGGSVVFFAARPPAERKYEISAEAVKINQKEYPIEMFKSFSVVEEGQKDSIWLKPTKRFAPFLIIYFHQEDEQRIIEALSALLPHEPRELDNLDRLARKLRF